MGWFKFGTVNQSETFERSRVCRDLDEFGKCGELERFCVAEMHIVMFVWTHLFAGTRGLLDVGIFQGHQLFFQVTSSPRPQDAVWFYVC